MSNILKSVPYMTPDSLRKTLKMLHSFYDTHTKKNYGCTDINGSQYSGIIENHATELLLEARKILMDKPSLKNFITASSFDNYFDIKYSNLISTYNQQNILVALLKKDALLSNKEYHIVFENCNEVKILRAQSWSDPKVKRDTFYHTTTPPKLVIHDNDGDVEKELKISDGIENSVVDYYFFSNSVTSSFIKSYSDNKLTTITLTDDMCDLPFVWICLDIFKLLPPIQMTNNADVNNNELLTIGTDGHDVSRIYPLIYGKSNIPEADAEVNDKWYIKVYPIKNNQFITSPNDVSNYSVPISSVKFIKANNIHDEPIIENTINISGDFIKVTLSELTKVKWSFRKPIQGDYDYDGTTYVNDIYAYIKLNTFISNTLNTNEDLLSAFTIKFNDNYLHKYECINGNATSGIHIDTASEYSDNGIDKKNGIVHDLCDFNGLPKYFSHLSERDVYRSHAELYTIRDDLNNTNQKVMDKQTAGLIVDSSLPRKEVDNILDNLEVVIKYKRAPITPPPYGDSKSGIYYADPDVKILSSLNQLSEIVYCDDNTFGNSNIIRHKMMPKFIYHGNRVFSLNLIEFDPELERGRVYVLSNDNIEYENNVMTNNPKPSRTVCRICDIPTSFVSLINIVNTAPTLIIDEDYVRTYNNLSEYDKNLIWNVRPSKMLFKQNENSYYDFIFKYTDNLDELLSSTINDCHNMINLNKKLDLLKDEYSFVINEGGSNYEVDDKFQTIIGGICYHGTVVSQEDGIATEVSYDINEYNCEINFSNISTTSTTTLLKTTTTSGTGSGLTIDLVLTQDTYDNLHMKEGNVFNDLIAFKYDNFDNVCIYRYISNKWVYTYQLTGENIPYNIYDVTSDRKSRDLSSIIIYNLFNLQREFNQNMFLNPIDDPKDTLLVSTKTNIDKSIAIDTADDLSNLISNQHINKQNALYVLYDDSSYSKYIIKSYEHFPSIINSSKVNNKLLSQFNVLNLYEYCDKTNTMSIHSDSAMITQPSLYFFDPIKSNISKLNMVTKDLCTYQDTKQMTFADILLVDNDPDVSDDLKVLNPSTGVLNTSVYTYNEYERSNEYNTLMNDLNSRTDRNEIINIIKELYGDEAYPLSFENTDLQYDINALINYIKINYHEIISYKKNDIHIMRKAHEKVVNKIGDNTYEAVGDQPTGAYVSISDYAYNPNLSMNNNTLNGDILYVFKIDDFESDDGLNDDFVLYDELGNDISKLSLLIINDVMYIKSLSNKWISIK